MKNPLSFLEGLPLRLEPRSSPGPDDGAAVCPHCWMVNPGPFRICGRCGADMSTTLQESGGLRRTAPVQSPVPVAGGARRSGLQRAVLASFVALLALVYLLAAFLPVPRATGPSPEPTPAPTTAPS